MRRMFEGLTRMTGRVTKPVSPLLCISLFICALIACLVTLPDSVEASGTVTLCTDCHGSPPLDGTARNNPVGQFPGTHGTHAGSGANQYGIQCEVCHTAPNYTVMTHQSDTVQVNLRWLSFAGGLMQSGSTPGWGSYSRGTSFTNWSTFPQTSFGTCQNTYCHSKGDGGTLNTGDPRPITANTSPKWGTVTPNCSPCHGNETGSPQTGAPWYTNATGGAKANSHQLHAWSTVGSPIGVQCMKCHAATTSTGTSISSIGNHIKRSYTLVAGSGAWGSVTFTYGYSTSGGTCQNASCHTSNLAAGFTKKWGSNANQATCVKCHGLLGQTQAQFTADNSVAAPGYWQTGRNTWGTTGLFTNGVSAAPKVWAHDSHLRSPSVKGYTTLRGVECSDCHDFNAIVADIYSAGHMNGTTQFAWSSLVRNVGNSNPKWNTLALAPWYSSGNQQCGNIYCHGQSATDAGVQGNGWTSLNFNNNQWLTVASAKDQASCNKCHQSPPARTTNYNHTSLTIASDCSGCHNHNGAGASHIDGTLYGAGACNTCHWYDTTGNAWTTNVGINGGTGLWMSTNAWGAHVKHINHLKTRTGSSLAPLTDVFGVTAGFNSVCGFCHTQNAGNHMNGTRQVIWNTTTHQFGASAMSWDTVTRSCSNLDCHYKPTPVW